ncbi:hypothetical protein CLU81_0538 [Flavobacterium sp. 9]|uniref:hypothetical protein n=1 Tax=Flavobacterium sp. 9 TaxID=2035198 RepID=UPI000C178BC4|nr:hypothetical protein [Flavobacterium sp. 9]PIF30135.1 hypothetical protein CLU81_0538 [Flavobacterium sp. 9]
MKKVLCLFLILGLISCVRNVKSEVKGGKAEEKKKHEDIGLFDKGDIFPVYTLSKKTTAAIVVEVAWDSQQTNLGKILEDVSKKTQYFDTLGAVKLSKSKLLETEIKKIIKDKYYVYGTRGFSEMNVGEVIFGWVGCEGYIVAFTIRDFDTIKNGNPIFCSSKLLKLNYEKKYSRIEKKINKFYNPDGAANNLNEKVFANIGSMYFSYRDDFQWVKRPDESQYVIRERVIYRVENDNYIERIWQDYIDMYGMNCD